MQWQLQLERQKKNETKEEKTARKEETREKTS
jgi:hypothetical protein